MKPIDDMSGAEKAAALLVALGPSTASEVLKNLDEESIEKITVEIARIDRISPDEREELIGEFLVDLRRAGRRVEGGETKARKILEDAFGLSKADDILGKIKHIDPVKEFQQIREIESDVLIMLLKEESPQTVAVTMSYLPPDKAAAILKSLPRDKAKEVARNVAVKKMIPPDVLGRVARTINAKYAEITKKNRGLRQAGGVEALVEILSHMSGDEERKILNNLELVMPEVSGQIKESFFSFDNIANLTNTEIRILIDELADDMVIARALKGAGDDIRFKMLRNMSQNRATDIINDMNAMGAVRMSEVNDNRDAVMDVARSLHENGVISFKKSGSDRMVE